MWTFEAAMDMVVGGGEDEMSYGTKRKREEGGDADEVAFCVVGKEAGGPRRNG